MTIKAKTGMKNRMLISCLLLLTILLSACQMNHDNRDHEDAKDKNENLLEGTNEEFDGEFTIKAASSGLMEVELGKLAVKQGQFPDVKDIGHVMIKEHGAANQELKSLAKSKNIGIPVTMSTVHQESVNRLTSKTGRGFDMDYLNLMVSAHEDDIRLFKEETEKGGDADLKQWAQGKLPVLEHHLKMVEEARSALKNRK